MTVHVTAFIAERELRIIHSGYYSCKTPCNVTLLLQLFAVDILFFKIISFFCFSKSQGNFTRKKMYIGLDI